MMLEAQIVGGDFWELIMGLQEMDILPQQRACFRVSDYKFIYRGNDWTVIYCRLAG